MPRTMTDDELDREVLFALRMHRGQGNAIPRWNLCLRIFNISWMNDSDRNDGNTYDRQIRRSIERMRRAGHLICNLGNGDGYFLAETRDEYLSFRAVYVSHAVPIMETAREMDKSAGEKFPNPLQPSLI